MLADFYTPRLSNDMQKNYLRGQILCISSEPIKNGVTEILEYIFHI